MICPHCSREIPDEELARHFAAKGGKSRSPEKLAALEKAREKRWPKKKGEGK